MSCNKIGFVILIFMLLHPVSILISYAQDGGNIPQAPPRNHRLRVFRDTVEQRLYWPLDKPVYVRLSTSDDSGAASHLLKNAKMKNSGVLKEVDRETIRLEMSGRQFVRWVNFEQKDTLMLQFFADGEPPEAELTFQEAAEYNANNRTFFGKGLRVNLSASDELSGLENIFSSLDGAEFIPYNGPLKFTQEKQYNARFYAVDKVGNASEVQSYDFTVDLTPPQTSHKIKGNATGSILAPDAGFILTAKDERSGVRNTQFGFDGREELAAFDGDMISVDHLEGGSHKIFYRSTDNVNNREAFNSFVFFVDNKAPELSYEINGDRFMANDNKKSPFVSKRSTIEFSATDNKTGVNAIHFSTDGGKNFETYSEPVKFADFRDIQAIHYYAEDNLDNTSDQEKLPINLDVEAPTSEFSFTGSHIQQRGFHWITSETKIKLSAEDTGSGVSEIHYSIIGYDQQNLYQKPFSVENEGRYKLNYYAVDQVNNKETANSATLIVDNTKPEIVINFSSSSINSRKTEDGTVIDVYPTNTTLYLGATDASSGTKDVRFATGEGELQDYGSPLKFDSEGIYTISIEASDKVGNIRNRTIRFAIGNQ